jgi:hypothetical protein
MIKKMNNVLKGRSYNLLDEILVIPQEALHAVLGKVWKLRVIVVILVYICAALGTVSIKGQEAFTRLLLLETENKAKDATIEKLQKENKRLEEKRRSSKSRRPGREDRERGRLARSQIIRAAAKWPLPTQLTRSLPGDRFGRGGFADKDCPP